MALTGIGAAAFTLTIHLGNVNPVIIGYTQTTFTIVANSGPNVLSTVPLALACSAGTTCAFSPNPIFASGGAGSTSTLTVSNLTKLTRQSLYLHGDGTSGSQTATLQLNLEFADFTLTATPSVTPFRRAATAPYTILVNPLFGFNQKVQLQCSTGPPPGYPNCTSTSPHSTSQLQWHQPRECHSVDQHGEVYSDDYACSASFPPRQASALNFRAPLALRGLPPLAMGNQRRARRGWLGSGWLGVRLATLSVILALNMAMAACRPAS